ncbi:MAG: hypothetical protein ABR601_01775 [Parasphingopyxis sp.]
MTDPSDSRLGETRTAAPATAQDFAGKRPDEIIERRKRLFQPVNRCKIGFLELVDTEYRFGVRQQALAECGVDDRLGENLLAHIYPIDTFSLGHHLAFSLTQAGAGPTFL